MGNLSLKIVLVNERDKTRCSKNMNGEKLVKRTGGLGLACLTIARRAKVGINEKSLTQKMLFDYEIEN